MSGGSVETPEEKGPPDSSYVISGYAPAMASLHCLGSAAREWGSLFTEVSPLETDPLWGTQEPLWPHL